MDMTELLRLLGLRQAYDAYQRNIGQPVANVAGPFGRGFLGLQQPEYGSEEAYRTGQAVGNMPGPNVPAGAIKMAAQVPGLLDAIQAARNSPELTGLLGLTAYHGSPYRFSKFDPTKIGTGEGAQAYGYGMYFAESPDVAKTYQVVNNVNTNRHRNIFSADQDLWNELNSVIKATREQGDYNVSGKIQNVVANALDQGIGFDTLRKSWESQSVRSSRAKQEKSDYLKTIDVLESNPRIVEMLEKYKTTQPSFYTVDISDQTIEKMLDWDKPLGQQSETIQRLAKQVGLEMEDLGGDLVARFDAKRPEGAELLRQQGIPGVRYYDQSSRTKGGGTRNFVVFPGEEEAIKMLKVE
jgi:hypothetical protein